jgi:hypothetical protein
MVSIVLRKELLAFLIFSSVYPFFFFALLYLSSTLARIALITLFLIPILWTIFFASRSDHQSDAKIAGAITCFLIPLVMFLFANMVRLPTLIEGVEFTETRMMVEQYIQLGRIDFSFFFHSPFFQTYYLAYSISSVCGLAAHYAIVIMLFFYTVFLGFIGIYALKVYSKLTNGKHGILNYLIVFSMLSASSVVGTNLGYRFIGELVFALLILSMMDKASKSGINSKVLFLLLVFGITIGDPVSGLISSVLFLIYAFLKKDFTLSVFSVIPLGYIFLSGQVYLSFLKSYSIFALAGVKSFTQILITGRIPERAVPWGRTQTISPFDLYFTTISYICLMLIIFILCLFYLFSNVRSIKKKNRQISKYYTVVDASTIILFIVFFVVLFSYIGAAVQPESPFSDIRTILLGYSTLLMLFCFASPVLLSKIEANRIFMIIIIILLLLSSFRIILQDTPKSFEDSTLVIEENRLDLRNTDYGSNFFKQYYNQGSVIEDYKVSSSLNLRFLRNLSDIKLLSPQSTDFNASYILLDPNGLKIPSTYIPLNVYEQAYQTGMNENLIYDNGGYVIFNKIGG